MTTTPADTCPHCGQGFAGQEYARESGPSWTSILGDGSRTLLGLPRGSVDVILTDPPYGSGGFTVADRGRSAKTKYVSTGAKYGAALPDIDCDAIRPAAWAENMRRFFAAACVALRPGGHLLAFMDWRNLPEFSQIAHGSGLRVRNFAPWNKGRGCRPYKGGLRLQSEYILWATNGTLRAYPGQPYLDGVFSVSTKANGKIHIVEKPLELMEELVPLCPPGGLIVDPYQGSGTTGVAVLRGGQDRRYIGIESKAGNYLTACERLAAATACTPWGADDAAWCAARAKNNRQVGGL